MKIVTGIALALLLSACSTTKVPLPDGGQGYLVHNCRQSVCYKRAAKICGGRYELVKDESSTQGIMSGGVGMITPRYALLIRCP